MTENAYRIIVVVLLVLILVTVVADLVIGLRDNNDGRFHSMPGGFHQFHRDGGNFQRNQDGSGQGPSFDGNQGRGSGQGLLLEASPAAL